MIGYDLVTVGEATVDLISADGPMSLLGSRSFDAVVGGAPTNVAITAARLGGRVASIACVGIDPFGEKIENALVEAGVVARCERAQDVPTTLAIVHRSTTTPEFFIVRGADALSSPAEIPESRWVHTSMFALSRDPQRSAIIDQLRRLPEHTSVSLDCNYHRSVWGTLDPLPTLRELGPSIDLLKLSLDDAERTLGTGDRGMVMDLLGEMGFGHVCLTGGGEEIWIKVSGEVTRIAVQARNVVDVTGAGDAYLAGAILATVDGLSQVDAALVGVEIAGRAIEVVGHLPDPIDRKQLYPSV